MLLDNGALDDVDIENEGNYLPGTNAVMTGRIRFWDTASSNKPG
jgi:hypothetical protein